MYKIIGDDGKEYGPVSFEQVKQWLREGRVNAQTKILSSTAAEWKTLGELPEFALAAPLAAVTTGATQPSVEEIVARDYRIEIGGCISRGWQLVKASLGLLIGGTVLVFLVQAAIQTPGSVGRGLAQASHSRVALMLPGILLAVVGGLASLILAGPLTAGLYWPYILRLRGQPTEIGDFFAGFKRGFVNLMLCQIVMSLLIAVCILPPAIVFGVSVALRFGRHSPAGIGLLVIAGVLLVAAILAAIYLGTCWFYALPLAIDRQMSFWDAMKLSKRKVSQHWWQVFGLTFVGGLVGAAGVILCCVGVVFTMPIALASFMCGYEVIFGRSPAPTA
jgi:hypothetical protein